MLDLENKTDDNESFIGSDVPKFDDVLGVFTFLHKNLIDARKLLQIRPVYRKQQENFDRVLKCVTHLIYLLEVTSKTAEEKQTVSSSIHLCAIFFSSDNNWIFFKLYFRFSGMWNDSISS